MRLIFACWAFLFCLPAFCKSPYLDLAPNFDQNAKQRNINDEISRIDLVKVLREKYGDNRLYLYEGSQKRYVFEDITSAVVSKRGMVSGTVLRKVATTYTLAIRDSDISEPGKLSLLLKSNGLEIIKSDSYVSIVDKDLIGSSNWPLNSRLEDKAIPFKSGADYEDLIKLLVTDFGFCQDDLSTKSELLNKKIIIPSGSISENTTVRDVYTGLLKAFNEDSNTAFSYQVAFKRCDLTSEKLKWGVVDGF